MDSSKRVKITFDGSTDVTKFVAKLELEASLKEYADEMKANFLASRLVGPAFDVYLRLTTEQKKNFDAIKAELKNEFERGHLNREEALAILQNRVQASTESPQTFAYKLTELVQLAYPGFSPTVRQTIAKDYYMKGVHHEMQVALKSRVTFATDTISTLATETVRLSLAGVKSYHKSTATSADCSSVDMVQSSSAEQVLNAMIDAIADVVVSKLRESSLEVSKSGNDIEGGYDGNINNVYRRTRGNRRRGGCSFRGGRGRGNGPRRCRSCSSTDHLIKNCPTKFCEACGQRGHSQYDRTCPNYS